MLAKDLLNERRGKILKIAARHGVSQVRVFGSTARGEQKPGSDLDILVKLDSGQSLLVPHQSDSDIVGRPS